MFVDCQNFSIFVIAQKCKTFWGKTNIFDSNFLPKKCQAENGKETENMNRRFKFIWCMVIVGIGAVAGFDVWYLYRLFGHAEEERREEITRFVEEACGRLALKAARGDAMVGYDESRRELVYEMDGDTIHCPMARELSHDWSSATPMYDVRDTSVWTLEALNGYVQELERERRGRELAVALTETDSWGRTLHRYRSGARGEGAEGRIEVPLGYLSQNKLVAEYVLPRGEIWAMCRWEAAHVAGFTLCVVLCVLVLFYYLRVERRNLEIRRFYMRMYRHDLRRLMGTAKNWLETLRIRTRDRLTEEERGFAAEGTEALDEVTDGLEQMIAVRVCEHSLRVRYRDVDIHALLGGLTNKEKWGLTGGKEVTFTTDFKAENPVARGEEDLLASMFVNLVSNALKYSGPRVEIRLATREAEGGMMKVTVEDNGFGIPAEMRERVFERGFRLERDEGKVKGSGWGLYMVKGIAEAHKGSVRLENKEGGGSRFVVLLRHKKEWPWG